MGKKGRIFIYFWEIGQVKMSKISLIFYRKVLIYIFPSHQIFTNIIYLLQMTSYQPLKTQLIQIFQQIPQTKTNILSQIKNNKFYITFNRPKRYNAFSSEMYHTFVKLILHANQNQSIKFIIISGSGGNFSSGNDLQNFTNPKLMNKGTPKLMAQTTADMLSQLNLAIINSKKPIFAITQGKVIGFAFTQLALYDRVFAVSNSQFNAPLVKLAQGPEMCASYTFPKIFGKNIGQDLIVNGTKVDTGFLEKYGFLTSYKNRTQAELALNKHLQDLDSLDWESYVKCRHLFRETDREFLLQANKRQIQNLVERWTNPQLPRLLFQYMSKVKSKSKL